MGGIGGQNNYPSLAEIANLIRYLVNDDKPGATGTPGEGQIIPNTSFSLQTGLQSAIRDVYRDCRIIDYAALIKDNYILYGVPPVNSNLGVGAINPAIQVSIGPLGYFDGLQLHPQWTLPSDILYPLKMWERVSGTQLPFGFMHENASGLSPRNQTQSMGQWEWRTDQIWTNGAVLSTDLRIRYIVAGINIVGASVDFNNTFVPIADSQEAIADRFAARYSGRLGGDALQYAEGRADKSILRLKQQIVKSRQVIDFVQTMYGSGTAGSAGNPATYLY